MRKKLIILLMIPMTLMVQGCTDERTDYEKASECVTQFIENTYNIQDHTSLNALIYDEKRCILDEGVDFLISDYERRIKPYATQSAIEEFRKNQLYLGIVNYAAIQSFDINVTSVSLDQFELSEDELFTAYEAVLILTYTNGIENKIIKKGRMQLVHSDGDWKINREKSGRFSDIVRISRK